MEVHFAPELFIPSGITDVSFYEKAFGAVENFRFTNDDGGIHVVELSIGGQLFHLHETGYNAAFEHPSETHKNTVCIGLFSDDPDSLFDSAIAAGAELIQPMTSHDYGYRQGMLKDPFGHYWQVQKKID